ncbi:hypothetical protein ABPG73_022787 [Tetrahymena malaccensis]
MYRIFHIYNLSLNQRQQVETKKMQQMMKIQRILTYILIILQILRYSQANQYKPCNNEFLNTIGLNSDYTTCIVNLTGPPSSSDFNFSVLSNTNCLYNTVFPYDSSQSSSGPQCKK